MRNDLHALKDLEETLADIRNNVSDDATVMSYTLQGEKGLAIYWVYRAEDGVSLKDKFLYENMTEKEINVFRDYPSEQNRYDHLAYVAKGALEFSDIKLDSIAMMEHHDGVVYIDYKDGDCRESCRIIVDDDSKLRGA